MLIVGVVWNLFGYRGILLWGEIVDILKLILYVRFEDSFKLF